MIAYRNYLLFVLLLLFAFNYVDRLALGLLLQDIKIELLLSDTQLGLLTGIAFAVFYSAMGIPIARWADRGNRVTIISVTAALWSAAVALCGLAGNFAQLLSIRVGVAIGEAGCMPPAHSLIADYFSRAERPWAVSRYMLGAPLSLVIGYFAAGWLNEFYGWRMTFVLLGLPGLALAVLARLSLKEPRRTAPKERSSRRGAPVAPVQPSTTEQPTMKEVWRALWANETFRHLLYCFSISSFFGYGLTQWKPAFFARSFGLQTGELGTWFAVIYGAAGLLGTYLGGEWASRRAASDERLQLKAMAWVYVGSAVVLALMCLSSRLRLALGLMAAAAIGAAATNVPLFATLQTLVPARMRAMSIAVIYLFANLIGLGLGPLAAGALSDAYRAHFGEESLRYALLTLCPGYLWAAWHVWRARQTVVRDLASVQLDAETSVEEENALANPAVT